MLPTIKSRWKPKLLPGANFVDAEERGADRIIDGVSSLWGASPGPSAPDGSSAGASGGASGAGDGVVGHAESAGERVLDRAEQAGERVADKAIDTGEKVAGKVIDAVSSLFD